MKRSKAKEPDKWVVPGYALVRLEASAGDVLPTYEQSTIGIMLAGAAGHVSPDGGKSLRRIHRSGDVFFTPRLYGMTGSFTQLPPRLLVLIEHWKEAEVVAEMFGDAPGRLGYRANIVTRDIQHLRKLLVQFVEHYEAHGKMYLESLLVLMTHEVFLEAWMPEAGNSVRRHSLSPAAMRRVLDHIEQNLGASITLNKLAEIAGLSRYHFNRCFRSEMGRPPYQFVLARRLVVARHLLESSDIPIAEIASRAGFTSQANLTTAFRRAFGVTPYSYRRNS
jgi:AraC family transcriptional regulator